VDAVKSFELERQSAYARLVLSADLNAFHWEDIQRSATEILAELGRTRPAAVIVDLTTLDYLGSAQLTLLVRIWKAIKDYNGRMVVELKGAVVREVLKTAGLLNVWEVAESREGAFQLLGLGPDGRRKVSMILPSIGLVALTAALAGVCITLWRSNLVDARIALGGQLACAGIALLAGLWTSIRGWGARRGLGAAMVVASAVLAVTIVFNHPRESAPSGGAPTAHSGKDTHDERHRVGARTSK
jgi:anti-anti-sigma factor